MEKQNSHNQNYKAQKEIINHEQKSGGSANTRIIRTRKSKALKVKFERI